MKRDTVSAFRSRAKATEASVDAAVAAVKAERAANFAEVVRLAREAAANHRRFTRDDVLGATHVRDQFGRLRAIIRVNTKSVTVDTQWPWTETLPFDKVRAVFTIGDAA